MRKTTAVSRLSTEVTTATVTQVPTKSEPSPGARSARIRPAATNRPSASATDPTRRSPATSTNGGHTWAAADRAASGSIRRAGTTARRPAVRWATVRLPTGAGRPSAPCRRERPMPGYCPQATRIGIVPASAGSSESVRRGPRGAHRPTAYNVLVSTLYADLRIRLTAPPVTGTDTRAATAGRSDPGRPGGTTTGGRVRRPAACRHRPGPRSRDGAGTSRADPRGPVDAADQELAAGSESCGLPGGPGTSPAEWRGPSSRSSAGPEASVLSTSATYPPTPGRQWCRSGRVTA